MTEKIIQFNSEKMVFWTLLSVLFLCIGFYMYFINSTVHNVVAREKLEAEAAQLTLALGSQEFRYISL